MFRFIAVSLLFLLSACSANPLETSAGNSTILPSARTTSVVNVNEWNEWDFFWTNSCTGSIMQGSYNFHISGQWKTSEDGTVRFHDRSNAKGVFTDVEGNTYNLIQVGKTEQITDPSGKYVVNVVVKLAFVSRGSADNEVIEIHLKVTYNGTTTTIESSFESECRG